MNAALYYLLFSKVLCCTKHIIKQQVYGYFLVPSTQMGMRCESTLAYAGKDGKPFSHNEP